MAGADYYSCDKCGCKTFYDADLSYGDYSNMLLSPRKTPMPDGNVGDMMVLCKNCAKENKVIIIPKLDKESE